MQEQENGKQRSDWTFQTTVILSIKTYRNTFLRIEFLRECTTYQIGILTILSIFSVLQFISKQK